MLIAVASQSGNSSAILKKKICNNKFLLIVDQSLDYSISGKKNIKNKNNAKKQKNESNKC